MPSLFPPQAHGQTYPTCSAKVPDDPTVRHHFLQVVSYLQVYKEVGGVPLFEPTLVGKNGGLRCEQYD